MNFNKGKVILPDGRQVKVTTIARDLAKNLEHIAPIKQGGKLINYENMLVTAYLTGCQKTGTVPGGIKQLKLEYKNILKWHKSLMKKQTGSWLRRLFKKKEAAIKEPVLKVVE
jgi:hypothetical protein